VANITKVATRGANTDSTTAAAALVSATASDPGARPPTETSTAGAARNDRRTGARRARCWHRGRPSRRASVRGHRADPAPRRRTTGTQSWRTRAPGSRPVPPCSSSDLSSSGRCPRRRHRYPEPATTRQARPTIPQRTRCRRSQRRGSTRTGAASAAKRAAGPPDAASSNNRRAGGTERGGADEHPGGDHPPLRTDDRGAGHRA
jgi:hypothetical protein